MITIALVYYQYINHHTTSMTIITIITTSITITLVCITIVTTIIDKY